MRCRNFAVHCTSFFVLLAVCSEICDVIVQVSMPSSSFLPGTRRALNLVAIALFLLVTIPIDDTKPADAHAPRSHTLLIQAVANISIPAQ